MNSELKNINILEWCGKRVLTGEHVEMHFRMDESGVINSFGVKLLNDEREIFNEEEFKEFDTMMTILNGERLRCAVKIAREIIAKTKHEIDNE